MNSTRARETAMGQCKYCVVHQYGVYIVDTSWLLIMLFTAIVYRKELFACLYGRIRRTDTYYYADSRPHLPSEYLDKRRPVEPDAFKAALGLKPEPGLKKSIPIDLRQDTQKINAPQLKEKPISTNSPVPYSPPPTPVVDLNARRPEDRAEATPMKVQSPRKDTFKLPTGRKPESPTSLGHKSTGSDYFNQMMRGKKPVASISQYLHIKNQQKQPKQNTEIATNVLKKNETSQKVKKPTIKDRTKKNRRAHRKNKK